MSLPDGVLTANLTFGLGMDDTGAGLERGRVTFLASMDRVWAATGDLILARNIVVELNGSAQSIPFAATDQPGMINAAGEPVVDWTLDAVVDYPGRPRQLITFALPTGGIDGLVVDFDKLIPVEQSDGTTVALTVTTSVAGITGAVAADELMQAMGAVTENDLSDAVSTAVDTAVSATPRVVNIGSNLLYPRPPGVGPVWWETSVVNGMPANAVDGDQVIEVAAVPQPPTVRFSDTFNRADAAVLGSTPVGALAWGLTQSSGQPTPTAGIVSNVAKFLTAGAAGNVFARVLTTETDGIFTARLSSVGARQGGVLFRYVDTNTHLVVATRIAAGNNMYRIGKRVGGVFSAIFDTAIPSVSGDLIEVRLAGPAVTVKINGVQAWTGTVAEAAGGMGYGFYTAAVDLTPQWDDLQLTALA